MNQYYCRKQFIRNPVEYIAPSIVILVIPEELQPFVIIAREVKLKIGKISALVIMRKLKINYLMANRVLAYV